MRLELEEQRIKYERNRQPVPTFDNFLNLDSISVFNEPITLVNNILIDSSNDSDSSEES